MTGTWIEVRCPTILHSGQCRCMVTQVSSTSVGPLKFKCRRCKQMTVVYSSEVTRFGTR